MRNSSLILLFFLLISCNNTNYHKYSGVELSNYREPTNPLILISIDGFRWDYFDKIDTPNFDRLIANGSKADGLNFKSNNIAKLPPWLKSDDPFL